MGDKRERRQPVAKLIGLGRLSFLFHDSRRNNHWLLPTQSQGGRNEIEYSYCTPTTAIPALAMSGNRGPRTRDHFRFWEWNERVRLESVSRYAPFAQAHSNLKSRVLHDR